MKFTLILLSLVSAASVSYAGGVLGNDNLSALSPGAGVYSRSMVTDIEDDNGSVLCNSIVRVDLAVNVAEKNITYVLTSVQDDGSLKKESQVVKVGRDSIGVYDSINGIRVNSINTVKGNSVVTYQRKDVSWLGVKGEWETYESPVIFTAGNVKIGFCTYRRVIP